MRRRVHDAAAIAAAVDRLVRGLMTLGHEDLAIVAIRRGGVALADRLARSLQAAGLKVEQGTVDVALYRDDLHLGLPRPSLGPTHLPFAVDGRPVVLVDDVFWTGRTARAALDAVLDFGRPSKLLLVALVERPGRELPIVPDVVGLRMTDVADTARVLVRLVEDGATEDEIVEEDAP